MTQLHELLAVETGLAETANNIIKETTKTLTSKHALFSGMTKTHSIFAEENQHLVQAPENKEVQSTVNEQLFHLGSALSQYWDVTLQKEAANQLATADIAINGTVIATAVPSIVLLGMEKKLTALIAVYRAIPTLDSATAWEADPAYAKANIFRTKNVTERQQTVVIKEFKEISPATPNFKAQIAEVESTSIIGKYTSTEFSGAISSFDKAEKLSRLTNIIRAIKQARQRANCQPVDTTKAFASDILDYING